MSYMKCINAVYKNDKVICKMKCNNDTEDYEQHEMDLNEFLHYVCDNLIQLQRQPRTKLEKSISHARRIYEMPDYDFDIDEHGKVTSYVIYYKELGEVKKTREEFKRWREDYEKTFAAIVKKGL